MGPNAANQALLFCIFIVNGIAIGILFDIFRILRKSFKTPDFITYIEDILFWILTGLCTLYNIFRFNNGEIRIYIFLGIALGILFYMLTFSKYFIKINVVIITTSKNIIMKIVQVIWMPFKFIFSWVYRIGIRPFSFLKNNIYAISTNFVKKIKRNTKKTKNNGKSTVQKEDYPI